MSEHICDTGHFDRTLCPEPCGRMHSFCDVCGKRQDPCAHEPTPTPQDRPTEQEWAEAVAWPREHLASLTRRIAPLIEREREAARAEGMAAATETRP